MPDGLPEMPLNVLFLGAIMQQRAEDISRLMTAPAQYIVVPTYDEAAVGRVVGDADVVVTSRFTPPMGRMAGRLRLLHVSGAGYDKIHPESVPEGAVVTNCYEHHDGMAEWVLMMALALSRRLIEAHGRVRRGDWSLGSLGGYAPYPELGGRTLGIIGLGRVGKAVARLAGAFGMRRVAMEVLPVSPEARRGLGLDVVVGPEELDRILRESDFVALAVPLLPSTRGLIDASKLRLMKPTAYLINPARAEIVEERALYETLHDGGIAGAALDPWYRYPKGGESAAPSDYPFGELDNVIMTPHVAGYTDLTMERRSRIIAANVDRVARGEPIPDEYLVRHLSRG